jgi:hypothetical protein
MPENIAASHQGEAAKIFVRPAPFGIGRVGVAGLSRLIVRAVSGGDMGEQGVLLNGFAELFQAVVNGADADAFLDGISFNIEAGAGLAKAKPEGVKLAVLRGDGGGDGPTEVQG